MIVYKLHSNFKSNRASIMGIKIDKIRGVEYAKKEKKFLPYIANKTLIEINTENEVKKVEITKVKSIIEIKNEVKPDKEVRVLCTSNQTKKEIIASIIEYTEKYSLKELNKKTKKALLKLANSLNGVKLK